MPDFMPTKRMNPWAIVAALCAVGLCPLFSIASIFAGFRALVEIKAREDTRGARLAWASMLLGGVVTGLWVGGMVWWNMHVRSMIHRGPISAMIAGQNGDILEFQELFLVPATDEEAARFLHELHARYGKLDRGYLAQDIEKSPVDGSKLFLGLVPLEAILEYDLAFENDRMVALHAKYNLFNEVDGGSKFTNLFEWIQLIDDGQPTIVYPESKIVKDSTKNVE